ncbi:TPA_asm: hypothetical protein [ssRNA phage Gerhypos.3_19]|uniref:Uncharacterized protein n=1 Tax=ssRNA phage Gerhypos.3_19 TaxID=2786292 RepID=A0A8S5KXW2_9VIRU|nr:hypothetical protein QIK74_gp4 [ssRNA phage Gerhypos.3_19]DAD50112.1 TPA_asm: hypothetical protein [ssRNA phage Gerhypos.3_19]
MDAGEDPVVGKANAILAVISTLLVPATVVFRLVQSLLRARKRK